MGRRSRECVKSYTRRTRRSSKSGSGGADFRLVPQRHRLHGRDLQEHRQDDICQGSCFERPFWSIQLQPRRKCQARYRPPRRRTRSMRKALKESDQRRSGAQSRGQEQAEAPAGEQQAGRPRLIQAREEFGGLSQMPRSSRRSPSRPFPRRINWWMQIRISAVAVAAPRVFPKGGFMRVGMILAALVLLVSSASRSGSDLDFRDTMKAPILFFRTRGVSLHPHRIHRSSRIPSRLRLLIARRPRQRLVARGLARCRQPLLLRHPAIDPA